jgi:DNA-binding GntR family transcriptional regulator
MPSSTHVFAPVSPRRLGAQIYSNLIEAIATNQLPEGAEIQEDILAAQMGVSKTPVREALRRLEAEGFIVADSHRTPEVKRLSEQDIAELYSVREYLERLAVRSTIERSDADTLAALTVCQAEAEQKLADEEQLEIAYSVAYNRRFHSLILEGAHNNRLRRMYELIEVDVRRLSSRSIRVQGRQRAAVVQHRAILEAILAKDTSHAETLITQHLRRAREDILAGFSERERPSSIAESMG